VSIALAKHRSSQEAAHRGPESLKERGLLARWFIIHRLGEEMLRAGRYGRPVAVMVARPSLLPGEQLPEEALARAAAALASVARRSDLAGWLDDSTVLAIMPETGRCGALAAANRWLNEMWLRSRGAGGQKWNVTALACPDDFATTDQFYQAVAAWLGQAPAADV